MQVYRTEVKTNPLLQVLRSEGYQAVDMHYHSCVSVDGLASIPSIINRCKQLNIGTSFTDHNHIKGALQAKKLAKKDVFLIPGLELTCHKGIHILLHFYDWKEYQHFYEKEMKKRVKANPWFLDINHDEAVELASKYNCLITTPHPYGPGFCGIKKFRTHPKTLKHVHSVEVLNAALTDDMNNKGMRWAKKLNKGITGGSDGHCLAELGNAVTLAKADSVEEFLNQIKKKKSTVIGKEERLFEDAVHAASKFIHEETKAPPKQLERMWKDRGLLEWNYLKRSLKGVDFFAHFHAHHQEPKDKHLRKHKHTKHLAKK